MNLWDKGDVLDAFVHRFTIGEDQSLDLELAPYDVIGSLAHARMLYECALLEKEDWEAIDAGLRDIYRSIRAGSFRIEAQVEDVHSQVEMLLTAQIGDAGKRLHTARSRNDQVLVDLKLFFRDRLRGIVNRTAALSDAFLDLADRHAQTLLPGYTHGQAAMPSSFGQWFAAHAESLVSDLLVLQAAYRMADRNPLGSAAGYGTSFPIDRDRTTALLGFEALHVSAIEAQLGRVKTDRMVAQAAAAVAATIGRFVADVCVYASDNYRFITLHPEITTGSSIMPHKRNPDVFELLRAHCNRLQSLPNEVTLLATNLPSGYHRDFQLLKESVLPSLSRLDGCLEVLRYALGHLSVNAHILDDQRYDVIFSVDAIRQRMEDGIPFRDAYRLVGAELLEGRFVRPDAATSSHIGSPGNPGTDRIRAALAAESGRFEFSRRDAAFTALLGDLPLP
ncbi:MAG: argininosuccinate lyase [Bacteroidota bacterium]|nr:argininosuccinate lyase [Bacteroidota bacterium]